MINLSLQVFCNRIVAADRITVEDVKVLAREVLPDGFVCRDEADMLIALERIVTSADPAFGDYLVAAVVDFAVWGERPTGYIDAGVATWLVGSLRAGCGPTRLAARLAREVIREAQASDEALIAFALAANRATADHERTRELLAA
ncbi:hypothetical protein ASF49_09015 [Methylobacterium sp. Leaf104]|uniref:hypothetical protein n=1 Tax=Methylobacterium TaxID=407 RepID=UPI0006F54FF5|nr:MULTISPECIES: hypothetical protein [Methylobacterium]KQP31584.1 hypothetical protein ASF49_09015 [Methylobacterium sp. Leaf104]MCI9880478.1 hypothetical protein [Methylobacterium goesingense]